MKIEKLKEGDTIIVQLTQVTGQCNDVTKRLEVGLAATEEYNHAIVSPVNRKPGDYTTYKLTDSYMKTFKSTRVWDVKRIEVA